MTQADAAGGPPTRAGPAARLWTVCGALGAAAVLLWAGSAAVWFELAPPGRPRVPLTGAEVSAVPAAVALLALAGVAAVVATRGPLRRGVGLLLALAGAGAGAVAGWALRPDPWPAGGPGSGRVPLPPGTPDAAAPGWPVDTTAAPVLAAAGAALLLLAGLFVLVREPRLAQFGARYDRRPERRAELDPDRAAWQELDAGRDPTAGPVPPRRVDPGDDGRDRAV